MKEDSVLTLLGRAILVMALLFGLVFAVGTAVMYSLEAPVQYAILFALAVVLLQYAIGPRIVEWVFKIRWVAPEDLGPETASFLRDLCARKGIAVPRIGIIEDNNPNAFTFGHVPADARIVVTRGLLEMLPPEEVQAVVGHEVGHVCNWDFVVMTLASSVPLVLYILYVWTRDRREGGGYVAMVGFGAYAAYFVSQYLVLLLSRIREFFADEFAARSTGDPHALSRALVRISYGLATLPIDPEAKKAASPASSLGALGIFGGSAASAAVAATGSAGQFSEELAGKAMRWDLVNPWARWFEWHSSHPLTARRVMAMNRLNPARAPYRANTDGLASYWPKFGADFFFASLTWLGLFGMIYLIGLSASGTAPIGLMDALGTGLAMTGIGWLVRLKFKYREGATERHVASLVGEHEVSHIRGIPVTLRGKIIGRGIPGLLWSDDLVLQDETGFVTLDYRQPLGFLEFLFGIFHADEMIGRVVVAHGWYRRDPAPYVELRRVEYEGKSLNCTHVLAQFLVAGLLTVIGFGFIVWAF
jgi:heat shock protein HtpX